MTFIPEVLSPAGDLEKLKTAYMYGADACYMGVKSMSMRVKENKIGKDEFREALKIKNKLGKKLYVTMNIHAHESRLNFLEKEIEYMTQLHEEGLDPDGLLISDVGVIMIAKEKLSWIPLHISTQANVLNSAGVEFWAAQGAERVVLGREASLREIKKIREELAEKGVKVELEAFVHGAMCMAYSGRCLLSNFMSNRDANEGMCSHSCRWNYKVHSVTDGKTNGCSDNSHNRPTIGQQSEYYLEEEQRPGEYYPIEEDEHGTYMMSSKDMCMIEHLDDVIDARVDSLKIEGRHKSIYYTAIATKAYREALDLAMEGKKPTKAILDLVDSIDTRGYFTGFWYGKPGAEGQKYTERADYNERYCFAGVVRETDGNTVTMEVRNRLNKGDELDIITPTRTVPMVLNEFYDGQTGELTDKASAGQGYCIKFAVDEPVDVGTILRKRLKKEELVKNRVKVQIEEKTVKKSLSNQDSGFRIQDSATDPAGC